MNQDQAVSLITKIIVGACAATAAKYGIGQDDLTHILTLVISGVLALSATYFAHRYNAPAPARDAAGNLVASKTSVGAWLLVASFALVGPAQAQTNTSSGSFGDGLKIMANALSSGTNWTAIAGYGRGLTGNKNVAFADVAYSLNQNVGVIAGYDVLWGGGQHEANSVKGGVSLQTSIHPFAFIGTTFLTNVVATPFAADCLATPKDSSAGIGNIVTTGANVDIYAFSKFEVNVGAQYENRTGQGRWDGGYALFHAGLTRKF